MYKRMLVPLDGSEVAEVVFPYARELSRRLGVEVVLLHISNPALKDFQPMMQAYVDRAAAAIRALPLSLQGKAYPGIDPHPISVHGEFAGGYPPDEILRYADEHQIDFILIASHGRSGRKRWNIGSVADRVLRSAPIPVLMVPVGGPAASANDASPANTIVVPLDGSELAETVLPHVEALATGKSARVVLVRTCEPPPMPTYYSPELSEIPLHWGQYAQQETARCKQVSSDYLAGVQQRLKASGTDAVTEILIGKAADEVVAYANKNPAALIVMATHGRSGFSRLVYGSVALNILVGVSNPIFLVKPKAKA